MALNILGHNLFWQSRIDNTRLQADAVKTQSIFNTLGKSISKAAIFANIGIAAAAAIKKIIKVNVQFEKSISLLSSLTGAVGEDLDFYRKKAIEFGESTTQSATQIADAFKLIGSKKPELLGTKEALADVTKNAITLAEAANVDVTTSASALTTSLNLMSEGADKSAEFINILAAASQKGAGDIPYLDRALEKSAKVAYDANLTFAETAAMVEMLAPAFKEPSTAGLHFKAVLLRLQKQGFGFSSGMFDLQEALQEVKSELDGIEDPAERAGREIDIMGARSITAGKVMVETRNKFKDFAATISGTNTAFEQAQTNTDNVEGAVVRLKSAIEGAILKNSDFNDSLKNIIDTLTETVRWLGENWIWIEKLIKTYLVYIAAVKGTAVAISLYNKISKIALLLQKQKVIQTGTLTAAQLGYTGVVKSSTIAQAGLNRAMKANVIGLVIAGVYAAIKLYEHFNKEVEEQTRLQKELNEIEEESASKIDDEIGQIGLLIDIAEDETRSKEEKLRAIKRLNEITPDYIDNITEETIKTGEARKAIDDYIVSIGKKIRAQIAEEKILKIQKEIFELTLRRIQFSDKEVKKKYQLYDATKDLDGVEFQRQKNAKKFHGALITGYDEEIEKLKETQKVLIELLNEADVDIFDLLSGDEDFKPTGNLDKNLKDQFKLQQEFELAKFLLIADNEAQIAAFRKDQEIKYLENEIKNNTELEQIEKDTYSKKIELLERERNAIIKSQFDEKEKAITAGKDMFKINQELALARFKNTETNEKKITEFKLQQEINRLQNQIDFNDKLIAEEKETLAEMIILLEKRKNAVESVAEKEKFLEEMAKKAGDMFASSMRNSEDAAESFGKTMANVTREVILMLIAESVAHVMKDVFKESGWLGLVLAPIAGAAAAEILNAVIPKFEHGGVFTGQGVVPGQGNKDNVNAHLTPNEVVLNGNQQANLLFQLANQRFNSTKMENLLQKNNDLLRNAKTMIIKGNTAYVVKNGKIIGGKTHLS